MGFSIRIESSHENGIEDNTEVSPKMCKSCGVRIGEEYSRCPLCDSKASAADTPDPYFKTALYVQPMKEVKHKKVRKPNLTLSKEHLKAYFNVNP
jgi:hypothetical protein